MSGLSKIVRWASPFFIGAVSAIVWFIAIALVVLLILGLGLLTHFHT